MTYTIKVTKSSDNTEYIVIEYSEDYPWRWDFKEFVMINVEEMEEDGRIDWVVHCDGPDGEETQLVLIQGAPNVSIESEIREMAAREWQATEEWYNEHREPEESRRDGEQS